MTRYQQQLRDIVEYCTSHFIAEVPHDIYDPRKEGKVPVTTTLLFLNSILGGNTLIEGDRGTGKTKLATVAGTLISQLPYEFFAWRKVTGVPGATVNDIYATHDVAELNRGNDIAFLYLPFHAPFLIIDELNRYSELEQNRIREGISTGVWPYANHSWEVPGQVVVSAINPDVHGGTFSLNENLIDNYALVLEPPHYNAVLHTSQVIGAEERIREKLGLEEKVREFTTFYSERKNDFSAVQERLKKLQATMLGELRKRDVPFIHNGVLEEVRKEISDVPLSPEGNLFFYSSLAELTYSCKYGKSRYEDPASDDTHDRAYTGSLVQGGLHGRFVQDWVKIAKAIAWYMEKKEADVPELKAAFIYTSCRRLKPQEEFYHKVVSEPRELNMRLEMSRRVVEAMWNNYSALEGGTGLQHVRKAIRMLNGEEKGDAQRVISILELVDHPLGRMLLEALKAR